jgi:hypothetical protein
MTLEDWQRNRWLKKEPTSAKEIAGLFALADRNLSDASVAVISLDARLQFAFNAALACATIALRASGYRLPVSEGHHEKTINSLKLTLKVDSALITKLNGFRKKRSHISYDTAGATSQSEVDDLLEIASDLHSRVRKWLKKHHPELAKDI